MSTDGRRLRADTSRDRRRMVCRRLGLQCAFSLLDKFGFCRLMSSLFHAEIKRHHDRVRTDDDGPLCGRRREFLCSPLLLASFFDVLSIPITEKNTTRASLPSPRQRAWRKGARNATFNESTRMIHIKKRRNITAERAARESGIPWMTALCLWNTEYILHKRTCSKALTPLLDMFFYLQLVGDGTIIHD